MPPLPARSDPMSSAGEPRIIVALDYPAAAPALAAADRLDPSLCRVKVGQELFTRAGPAVVAALHERGFEVFLDLKFHDIPNTVAAACAAAAELGVWMVNVHASGGSRMMQAARERLDALASPPLLIAVTVLTSLERADLDAIGCPGAPAARVAALAALARAAGLDGVVCSAHEAAALRRTFGAGCRLVTPGVRPAAHAADDQRRVMSPAAAIAAGADDLVIGRPITAAADPGAALRSIASALDDPGDGAG